MKWTCSVCGYTYEGPEPPAKCPQCGVPADKFVEVKEGEIEFVDEHVVGVAQGVDPEIIQGLKDNFNGECSEVGMYLAMARVAHREGYPEIGLYWSRNGKRRSKTRQSICWSAEEILRLNRIENPQKWAIMKLIAHFYFYTMLRTFNNASSDEIFL